MKKNFVVIGLLSFIFVAAHAAEPGRVLDITEGSKQTPQQVAESKAREASRLADARARAERDRREQEERMRKEAAEQERKRKEHEPTVGILKFGNRNK